MRRTCIADIVTTVVAFLAIVCICASAQLPAAGPTTQPAASAAGSDWPQLGGPNRNGIAVASPKLLDAIPKDGPPVLWRSDWIPGFYGGGCGEPVLADGKVYVYSNAKVPLGGGTKYKLITDEALANAGWQPDLQDELAKKIEAAWASPARPKGDDNWLEFKDVKARAKDIEALLAK